jgi:hypothetical protein
VGFAGAGFVGAGFSCDATSTGAGAGSGVFGSGFEAQEKEIAEYSKDRQTRPNTGLLQGRI